MQVANTQPKELLTAGRLTNLWPLVWHSQARDQVQPKDPHKVGNKACTHKRRKLNPHTHHDTDHPLPVDAMQLLAAFWKAEYLLRFAVRVTNLTLYQDAQKREMPFWGPSDSQSIHQNHVDQPEQCNGSSKPHHWFEGLKTDEKHFKPKKENTNQVLHTELQCINSSERLQIYMLWDSAGTCSGGDVSNVYTPLLTLHTQQNTVLRQGSR